MLNWSDIFLKMEITLARGRNPRNYSPPNAVSHAH